MRLIAIQLVSGESVQTNLQQAEQALAKACPQAGDLVLLPENFALMAKTDLYWQHAETLGQGPIQSWLSQQALRFQCYLVAGSMPISAEGEQRCHTSSIAFGPQGQLLNHYHKLHLFDVEVADGVGSYRESDSFVAGQHLSCFQADPVKVGMSICFDLRYPYLFQLLRQQGCDIVLVPAAFTYTTGKAHWQTLLQARAIENQLYIVAANQGGQHSPQRRTWGHSMIVDPWGECHDIQAEGLAAASAVFDANKLAEIRAKMPLPWHQQLNMDWSTHE